MTQPSIGFVKSPYKTPFKDFAIPEAPPDVVNFVSMPEDRYVDILKLPPDETAERIKRIALLMNDVGKQNEQWAESAFRKIHASYPWIDTLMVDPHGRTVIIADAQGFQFRGFWGAPIQYNDVRRPPTSEELAVMASQLQMPLYMITHPLDTQLYVPHDIFSDVQRAFERGMRTKKQRRVPYKITGKEGPELSNAIIDELSLIETEICEMPFKPEKFAMLKGEEGYVQIDVVRVNKGTLGSLEEELQETFALGRIVLKDIGQKVKDREGLGFRPAGTGRSRETEVVGYYPRVYLGNHNAMPYIELPDQGRKRQPVYITPFSEADELLGGKIPTSTGERAYVVHANPQTNLAVDALMAYRSDSNLNGVPLILTHTIDRRWANR